MNLWDFVQHQQIRNAREETEMVSSKVDALAADRFNSRQEVEKLTLACQAMWELLRDHTGLSDAHLKGKILEVDARDGKVDGRVGPQVLDCPNCGRKASNKRSECVYCGQILPNDHVMT